MAKKTKGKKRAPSTAQKISEHHVLRKQIAQSTDPFVKQRLLRQQAQSNGLEEYQETSLEGAQGGETSEWLIKTLLRSNLKLKLPNPTKLLDVGAIAGTGYAEESDWIDATYIDLNSKAAHVIQSDFMDFPLPAQDADKYDIVCLSLVLNFEGDLAKRGDMLIHVHNFLKPQGLLFIVLPAACIRNSRYMNEDHFRAILNSVGFEKVVQQHDSAKLSYWLVERVDDNAGWDGKKFKKPRELRRGKRYNNFTIVVR